jgi:SAM-dependent methyltransferase
MAVEQDVSRHYGTAGLLDRILAGLRQAGVDPDRASAADLKPVDEFHIGGAAATEELLAQVPLAPDAAVVDIGSGIGGTARLIAERSGVRVTGIDLTREFVETATALSALVGMGDRVSFHQGSALEMPFDNGASDFATLIHVGMNIEDKHRLMAETARVLRPGAHFAVYEVMRTGEGDLAYPVPWARTPETSFVVTPNAYRAAAMAAGFAPVAERNRRDFALDFFIKMRARVAEHGMPPTGIHLLMSEELRHAMIGNMIANIEAGRIAPVEMILRLAE